MDTHYRLSCIPSISLNPQAFQFHRKYWGAHCLPDMFSVFHSRHCLLKKRTDFRRQAMNHKCFFRYREKWRLFKRNFHMTCPIKMACLPPVWSCSHVPFGHFQAKTMITNFNDAKSIDLTLNFRAELHLLHNSVHSILPRIINPLLIHLQSIIHESKNP